MIEKNKKDQWPIQGFILTLGFAVLIYFILLAIPKFAISLFPYDIVSSNAPSSLFYRFIWFIEDFTNAQFYASFLAGLGLILGAVIAYILNSKNSKYGGFTIVYTKRLFPWIISAQLLSLSISVSLYIHLLETMEMAWIPTFIPFVSVPVIVILVYGPSLRSVLTGSILSGLLSTPIAAFIIKFILDPLALPAVSANVFTMALVGIIVLEICRNVPWMKELPQDFYQNPSAFDEKYQAGDPVEKHGTSWFMRRVLADFTEAQFYGNEWASGMMLIGLILHYILDRSGVYYGNDFVPLLIATSILGSAVGVFLYHKRWQEAGFYATFTPVVTIIPGIILLVNGDIVLSIIAAIAGGIIAPPFADMINRHIPKGWHPMIGNTLSMATCTALIAMLVKALPYIGIGH